MIPHSGAGAATPSPRNDSPAAFSIAQPRFSDACTAIAGAALGSSVPSTTATGPSPHARAASTQPRPRRCPTSTRATRRCSGTLMTAVASTTVPAPRPSAAASAIATTNSGSAISASASRPTQRSSRPPA